MFQQIKLIMKRLLHIILPLLFIYTSLTYSKDNSSSVPSNPHLEFPTYELMRVGASDSSKSMRFINQLPPGETDPTKGSAFDIKPQNFIISSKELRYNLNYNKNIVALNSKGDTLLKDITKLEYLKIYPEFTPDNDKITEIIIPIIYTGRIDEEIVDSVIFDFRDISITPYFVIKNKNQVFKPDISITNQKFSDYFIQNGLHPESGKIIISNTSYNKDNLIASDVIVHSIEIDSSAPNYKQFTNFRVEETGQSIKEIKDYILEPNKELTITYDFNTNNTQLGQHLARLLVLSDAGEITEDGLTPITENNYNVDFDGNFTESSPSGIIDGGYIQANLIFDPQSSVEISEIVNQFEAKLISENPTNTSILKIKVITKSTNKANLSISDINGRIVKELGENEIAGEKELNIDIAELKSGVYFVTISAKGINRIIEFVIAR